MSEPVPLSLGPRPTFPMREVLSSSWEGFRLNLGVLFFSHLIFQLVAGTVGPLLLGTLWYGLSVQALRAARGERVTVEQMFEGFPFFLPTLLWGLGLSVVCGALFLLIAVPVLVVCVPLFDPSTQLAFTLTFAIGMGLALLPIVAVTVLYAPTMFFMLDYGMEVRAAMRASQRMVLGNLGEWMRLWGSLALLHLLGLAACCVGSLFTTPWMAVALAEGYRREQLAVQGMGEIRE